MLPSNSIITSYPFLDDIANAVVLCRSCQGAVAIEILLWFTISCCLNGGRSIAVGSNIAGTTIVDLIIFFIPFNAFSVINRW